MPGTGPGMMSQNSAYRAQSCVSQKDWLALQNWRRLAPAVAWQAASARSSAVGLSGPIAQPTPGVPALGSKAVAKHSRVKVATIRHNAAILGAPSYLRQVSSAWSIAACLVGLSMAPPSAMPSFATLPDAPTASAPSAAAGQLTDKASNHATAQIAATATPQVHQPRSRTSMASPSPNRSIMGVAKGLLELAELAARRARGRLAGRERAFLGGCLGGPDRPADARRAGLGIEIDREAFAPEGRHDPADRRHLGGALVFAAGRERLVDRGLLGRLVDGAADRKAVLGEIPGGADGERALGACNGSHPLNGGQQDGADHYAASEAAHADAPMRPRAKSRSGKRRKLPRPSGYHGAHF